MDTHRRFMWFLVPFTSGMAGALVVLIVLTVVPGWRTQMLKSPVASGADRGLSVSDAVVGEARTVPEMVEKVNRAVVSVVITKDVPTYERYYEQWDPFGFGGGFSVPRVRENGTEQREVGGGSGFIVNKDGLVVTNRHVVADSEARYSVILNDGTNYDAEVLARDPQLDVAVLKINSTSTTHEFPFLEFGDSTQLRLGETVVAIGNALAEFHNSVSVGVVSGLSRSIVASDGRGRSEALRDVIQTDAAINPGNSGGPLLNLRGQVVGVNVATSQGADNIGFALPAHVVRSVVESVEKNGKIVRPFLGVRYVMIDDEIKKANNLTVGSGALVLRGERREELAVMPGSPADKAGLRENDIILAVGDEELGTETDLATALRRQAIGVPIVLQVLSQGEEKNVTVTLTEAPE